MQFKTVQSFLDYAHAELNSGRLILPTLPDVAISIRNMISNDCVSAKEVADVIATDPSLSARLVRIANNPLFRGVNKINNIQMAVARLGNNTVSALIVVLVMEQMFSSNSKAMEMILKDIWKQSISVSAISRALSPLVPHINEDDAMLAGLIHQIGKLPVLALAEHIPEFRDNPHRMRVLLAKTHPAVGKLIMDSWDFPDDLKRVASEYINLGYDSSSKADYVDVVQVAYLHKSAEVNRERQLDYSKIPSLAKLGLKSIADLMNIEGFSSRIELVSGMLA